MSNYLIRRGQTWSVKVAIPSDVQHIFGKKQFKQSLQTADIRRAFTKIKIELQFDGRYVFHSLRKTVATQLEQAGGPEGIAADILGHSKNTMSYGLYSGGSSLEQKREAILKLNYGLG